jgi:hypothetical protein
MMLLSVCTLTVHPLHTMWSFVIDPILMNFSCIRKLLTVSEDLYCSDLMFFTFDSDWYASIHDAGFVHLYKFSCTLSENTWNNKEYSKQNTDSQFYVQTTYAHFVSCRLSNSVAVHIYVKYDQTFFSSSMNNTFIEVVIIYCKILYALVYLRLINLCDFDLIAAKVLGFNSSDSKWTLHEVMNL